MTNLQIDAVASITLCIAIIVVLLAMSLRDRKS
jgi:hypothetical protein